MHGYNSDRKRKKAYDPEQVKNVKTREEAHFHKYGTREIVTEDDPVFLVTCPMTRYQRPSGTKGCSRIWA